MTTATAEDRNVGRPARAAFRTTKVRVTRMGQDAYQVQLQGTMRPGWAGSVSLGLSRASVSIDRAYAVRAADGAWRAELDVRRLPGGESPERIPYGALVEQDADVEGVSLAIERFDVVPSRAHGGTLALTVHARDGLGFLGGLLGRLAFLSLFPAELRIETHGDRIFDRFWLTGVAGGTPRPEARAMLAQHLERALAPAPSTR